MKLKKNQKIWLLQPDYPLGYNEVTEHEVRHLSDKIIYKVVEATYIAPTDDYSCKKQTVILDKWDRTIEVYENDIYETEPSAKKWCKKHNEKAISVLGERVRKLEDGLSALNEWARGIGMKR